MTFSILGLTVLFLNAIYAFIVREAHHDYFEYSILGLIVLGPPLLIHFKNQIDKWGIRTNINSED